jgi:serine protease Do
MDEQDRHIISFEKAEEPEEIKTVELEAPEPAAEPEVSTVIEPDTSMRSHTHAAPEYPSHSAKKEKKYVTRGALIACMILTMIVSSMLGAFVAGSMIDRVSSGRTERDDSKLSQLDLSDATGSEMTVGEIIKKNEDAVVEIVVSGTAQNMWGQFQLTQGAGSGVIVKEDGYIATNYHVIQGATKVQVTLHNGEQYSARIVGSDPSNDVAVIKIDAKDLTTATVGDSSTVEVGDLAVAIGNPLGQLGGTATSGIISALDRTLNVEGTTLTLLQTDAAINGGNSGGGLFNSKGELIGIVESKASAVGVEGLAFALPINNVSGIINDIIENGGSGQVAASTPAVGIVISDVSEENAQYYGLESAGVYIAQVTGENAQKAGFQEEDRIISFNGTEIKGSSEFISLVRKCKVGDTVTVVVSRGGQQIEIKTVLEELQQ